MNIPTKLAPAIALALGVSAPLSLSAVTLNNGDRLHINASTVTEHGAFIDQQSWFGMDNGNLAVAPSEQTGITTGGTLMIGATQSPGEIDEWSFFNATGQHYTTVAPTGSTEAGLDFSGWTVFWNGNIIPMGVGAWTPTNCSLAHMGCDGVSFVSGLAAIDWDGSDGGTFTIWYSASVPEGFGFDNVPYVLKLVGSVEINVAPTAGPGTIETSTGGTPNWLPVVDDDNPDDINLLTCAIDTLASNGTATIAPDCSSGTYAHDGGPSTEDSFTYSVTDGFHDPVIATVTVNISTVVQPNNPPTAGDVSIDINTGASTTWTPTVNDEDGDSLVCEIASAASNGTATIAANCGSGTYEHDGGPSTDDSFTYSVSDGTDTTTATVTVTITAIPNVAPTATDVTAAAIGTIPTNIDLTNWVTDTDGTIVWSTLSVTCASGTTSHNNAGIVTYTAADSFVGIDSCNYNVSDDDGAVSNTATLNINVSAAATGGTLPAGTVVLQITPGVELFNPDGSKQDVKAGSWFGMDNNSTGSIQGFEKTALQPGPDGGIIIGTLQAATGTHSGAPNGSENASIDAPWNFFNATGMHFTAGTAPSPINGDTANGIDLSGWRVTWNSIPAINMGAGAWTPLNCADMDIAVCAFGNGVAQFTWEDNDLSGNISDGDSYRLIYAATVPAGDPSGFGNVRYILNLEGTIAVIPAPTAGAGATLLDGDLGGTDTNGFRPTQSLPADADYSNVGGYYDYKVDCGGAGCSADVFIPLSAAIPANAVLRKFGVTPGNPAGGWSSFDDTGSDSIASADSASGGGDCAAADYSAGLTAGHDCLRVTQMDGGPNDTDPTAGIIGDPSGIAVPAAVATPPDLSSGTSGCTIASGPVSITKAGDWLLIGTLLAGLGLYRRRQMS